MHSVDVAAKMIKNKEADIIISGGMEKNSSAPHIMNGRKGKKIGSLTLEYSILKD